MGYVFLFIAIVAEVIATTSLKSSEGFTRLLPSAIVVTGYATAFYCLSLSLKVIPIGVAYAIWSGLGIVIISTAGYVLFKERLDFAAVVGMGLILAGVLVMNLFSKTV